MAKKSAAGFGSVPEELKEKVQLSASAVMDWMDSPELYYSRRVLKEMEPSKAMQVGTAIHTAILEPHLFDAKYSFKVDSKDIPGCLVTKEDLCGYLDGLNLKYKKSSAKPELIKFIKENCKDYPVIFDEYMDQICSDGREALPSTLKTAIERIKKALQANQDFMTYFDNGIKERFGWFYSGDLDVVFRFKMDLITIFKNQPYAGVVHDLKKTGTAKEKEFGWAIEKSNLHVQGAIYTDAMSAMLGGNWLFAWIAVEESAPFRVLLSKADDATLEVGQYEYKKATKEIIKAHKENRWVSTLKYINQGLSDYKLNQKNKEMEFYGVI